LADRPEATWLENARSSEAALKTSRRTFPLISPRRRARRHSAARQSILSAFKVNPNRPLEQRWTTVENPLRALHWMPPQPTRIFITIRGPQAHCDSGGTAPRITPCRARARAHAQFRFDTGEL